MMAVLPVLCDGAQGVAGWIPVEVDGNLYVVLCKRLTEDLMGASINTAKTDIMEVFDKHMEQTDMDPVLFKKIMLCAPLQVYKKGAKMKADPWLTKT